MIEVTLQDHMGSDLDIVNAAKVSYGNHDVELTEKGQGLIKFLARGMPSKDFDNIVDDVYFDDDIKVADILKYFRNVPLHKSPFNHAFMRFHVRAPIFVARQLVKHEYLPWNEISGRYVEFEPDFHMPENLRAAAPDKKQGSGPVFSHEIAEPVLYSYQESCWRAFATYKRMLETGVCEEQARMVLPLSTMTEWIWSGSVGAFGKMCSMRLREDTQLETRLVAQQIDKAAGELFPISWRALVHGEY